MYSRLFSAQPSTSEADLIKIETNISIKKSGTPQINIVGLPDKAVEEAKDRVHSAIENINFNKLSSEFKNLKDLFGKVTISLSPADIKKTGSIFDLPIAIAYLAAWEEVKPSSKDLFVGELSLNGDLHKVNGVLSIAKTAKKYGFKRLFLPYKNAKEAALIKGIKVYPIKNLLDLILFLRSELDIKTEKTVDFKKLLFHEEQEGVLLDDIKGNELAKRALTLAAAGRHNIAFYGPPGTGKTLLARALRNLIPPLTYEESLEVTGIYSAAGVLHETVITKAPFRAPHHSSSYASIIGGGVNIKPGEVTLAHKGVLFLDEFPEFDRRVINSLREPLEEKKVRINRASGNVEFPADFILVIAMNPCPCGFYGTDKCVCSYSEINKYQNKISGPIKDRIDIWVKVDKVEYEKLLDDKDENLEHREAQQLIKKAANIQKERYGTGSFYNSSLNVKNINKYLKLDKENKSLLNEYAKSLDLSARAYHKTIKLARTIADVEGSEKIEERHILEALSFKEPKFD